MADDDQNNSKVQIPSKAVTAETDVRGPVTKLLQGLKLLGSDDDYKDAGAKAVLAGPPDSVALIEAGATTATKYWAAGMGAVVVVTWGKVLQWWGDQDESLKVGVVAGAAFVTAAVVVAISVLFASDVRGRASAAVATIQARAQIAVEMIEAAQDASVVQFIALNPALKARNLAAAAAGNERGWRAVAMERHPDGKHKYVLVKGASEQIVEISDVEFE